MHGCIVIVLAVNIYIYDYYGNCRHIYIYIYIYIYIFIIEDLYKSFCRITDRLLISLQLSRISQSVIKTHLFLMFSFHASVTLSSIFACRVLLNIHCEILITQFHYLNLTVRNKINQDICFYYYISHNIANVIILLHYICCSSTLRM